ncbi:CHAP domain-containing protein [Streptomyces sp. SP17BM10]|uniref:C40 family peptidase n=1 Tax=Streptomyces sp. SP17BM10 TaxID=3002530 RepID=UPI002E78E290|nr:CHAP domain-containing protein [Streptomyces sp. SP17BM10]MEE1782842.1 CHAP domain-containing protein [Streptomyces sp. SP17BM10]
MRPNHCGDLPLALKSRTTRTSWARTGWARTAVALTAALVVSGALGTEAAGAATPPSDGRHVARTVTEASGTRTAAALRDRIVSVARGEIGVREGSAECNKYFPNKSHTCKTGWCAAFVEWTWREAGVKEVPTDLTGRGVGHWGKQHGLWHPIGSARPEPGDLVVYGEPAKETPGGHVGVVAAVHGDGTLDTVEGNYGDKVTLRTHLNPRTAVGGAQDLHIAGYVTPPTA